MTVPLNAGDSASERLWPEDDVVALEDRSAYFATGMTSLRFIRAALRRSRRFWYATALLGFLLGAGIYVASPHTYQASTSLILTVGPEASPGTAIQDDQAMAESRSVAALALRQLGIREDPGTFAASYTATVVTDRVLVITVNAPSGSQAVSRANAVAEQFLSFRAHQLRTEQQLQFTALDQQINQAKQDIKALNNRISALLAQPPSPAQDAKISALREQRNTANNALTTLAQSANNYQATTQQTTASMVGGSRVLDTASPLPHSRFKPLVLYAVTGLLIGFLLGVTIIVIRALLSDRLRRRDDVAHALGVPVRLSVPAVRVKRRLGGKSGLAAAQGRDVQRIVTHLRDSLPQGSRRPAALVVVPVDNPQVAALSVASLAVSCAQQRERVVMADLCGGAPAAALLGANPKDPGVQTLSVDGAQLAVAIPDPDEVAPAGPLGPTPAQAGPTLARQLAANASVDVLITLAALDPSVGAEHLPTWAADAVVVVTAGRSPWPKIQGVGEMIRLAGLRQVSAVLVGADKTDESLGVMTPTPDASRAAEAVERRPPADGGDSFVAVSGRPGTRASDDR